MTIGSAQSRPAPGPNLLHQFRSDRKRLPLHPLEKAILIVVALHLCFLPWALGTMHVWSQLTSLGLAALGLGLALIPRNYSSDLSGGPAMRLTMWPRLLHFPIFWLGLTLLGYVALQASNPSWVWERNATAWWLRRVDDIPWLPTSVDTPFERFDIWRQFIIYTSAWLTVCTVWTGFTRRRSLQLLLTTLVIDAIVLAAVGFMQGLTKAKTLLWLVKRPEDSTPFASFIYKNHAGAYLALITMVAAAFATWYYDRGERGMKKSTPAGLLAFATMILAGTVFFTLSRGASISLVLCAAVFAGWFFLRQKIQAVRSTNPALTTAVVVMFLVTLLGTARYLDFSSVYEGLDRVINQQSQEMSVKARVQAYEAGQNMLGDHWLRGVGAGGFRYLFPEYAKKHPEIYESGHLFWEHAHRDWFEIPIELGLTGSLLLLAGGAWWFSFFINRRAGWHSLAVPLLLGCGQTLIHAWFDFPFQNPAILITWCALIGISARWIELD